MRVVRLSTTPVKGLALHHPRSVAITRTGAVGDRAFFLSSRDSLFSISKSGNMVSIRADWDEESGRLTLTERGSVLATGAVVLGESTSADFFGHHRVSGRVVEGPWAAVLSERAGRPVILVKADEVNGARDVEPLTLLGEESVRELARQSSLDQVDARRFRMLLEFDGAPPHAEDSWEGRHVRIGSAVLEVRGPVKRCAGTTRNPDTGTVDLRTLTLIGAYRGRQTSILGTGFNFGVYARTAVPGLISVGDDLVLA